MALNYALFVLSGIVVGVGASFTGLGGGFLMVPLLITLGYTAQKAVGTSFLAILIISLSALIAHGRLANVDYRVAIALGLGGLLGAQIGPYLLEHVPTANFKKIFAVILLGLAAYLAFQK
ncbi:MAG: sulfite exporter TauE/SafE family protein [Gammaproteobacteria bacterium]|nr:sulfite exporter TauE/SafE family protein [Gammaproteobacteria bacterium]